MKSELEGVNTGKMHRGSNQSGMRAYNERLVLSLLRRHGPLAKSEIARKTGLSAQTVSVIMRALESDGLLRRGAPTRIRGKVGQPSIPLSLDPDGAYFLGLKLGRRSCDLILIDFLGNIIDSAHLSYLYPAPGEIVDFTREAVARITEKLSPRQHRNIAGLGIGMPFQLWDWVETFGASQKVMDAWRTADIRAQIEEQCGYPTYLQNDGTAACGAELVFGKHPAAGDFIYFYIGYFIGGGIVLNDSLYPGRTGNAGAFGSMPVPDGKGGSTQLIDVASISTLERAVCEAEQDPSSLWVAPPQWEIDRPLLDTWIDSAAKGIAHAIVSSMSVIDFNTAMIDGWLPQQVRSAIVDATTRHLKTMKLSGIGQPEVKAGTVGPNARALGAASLPLSTRFLVDQNALLKER